MKTLLITIFISVLFIVNTKAQISYHITGSIDRTDIDKVYLFANNVSIDSSIVKGGKFEMKGTYKMPAIAYISTKNPVSGCKIILDNGEYTVLLDVKLFPVNIESTSINNNLWHDFLSSDELNAMNKAKDSLVNDYKLEIEKGNYDLSARYIAKYHDIQLRMLNYYKKLVIDHTDCYVIPYLLGGDNILTKENFGSTFEKLSPEVKKNEWGQKFRTKLESTTISKPDKTLLNLTILGTMAQYFDTKQADGKIFNLASLKGKWILLDFWASWCAPCRTEVPFLRTAFMQFKDKNFVISSVSVDSHIDFWQKALKEDDTPQFIHTIIAEFIKSEGFKFYNITSIPSNFLINPEGRIVALDLRGEELLNTLKRLIK
jgi:peroxiredoxin